jgi:hypothetical protein
MDYLGGSNFDNLFWQQTEPAKTEKLFLNLHLSGETYPFPCCARNMSLGNTGPSDLDLCGPLMSINDTSSSICQLFVTLKFYVIVEIQRLFS